MPKVPVLHQHLGVVVVVQSSHLVEGGPVQHQYQVFTLFCQATNPNVGNTRAQRHPIACLPQQPKAGLSSPNLWKKAKKFHTIRLKTLADASCLFEVTHAEGRLGGATNCEVIK